MIDFLKNPFIFQLSSIYCQTKWTPLVNQQAIDYAIQIALLFNCRIVDEIHIIRKQYLDGSIPTGFQRTMIIGVDGWIPYSPAARLPRACRPPAARLPVEQGRAGSSRDEQGRAGKGRKITITQVNLEEEACREVSDIGHCITFATDRLSIPLVEIITASDMKNPLEAAEVCRLLGNAMKITGLVRRGIGTVRQDVNVSIAGGNRVEIKGVFKVKNIRPLTAIEAIRQKRLLELKNIFSGRFQSADNIPYEEINLTPLFSGTKNIIGHRLESDLPLKVTALLLPNMADIIGYQLQPHWNFGSELSGRVRVIACLDTKPILFFYSRREEYDIPDSLWNEIKGGWPCRPNDDIVIICGSSDDVITATNEIKIRISELAIGVINETRQDMKDGTTDFERILPGPDRMYPDTDHPPVRIADERVAKNRQKVGEPLWEKQQQWEKMGLHREQISALSLSPFADVFNNLAKLNGINIRRGAHILISIMVDLRRSGYDLSQTGHDRIQEIIGLALSKDWPFKKIRNTLISLSQNRPMDEGRAEALDSKKFDKVWHDWEGRFICHSTNNRSEKFKRFMTGRMIDQFPNHTREILTLVEQRLK
ncbi:MAG: hypothetical protein NTV06_04875 [candidate division Zixibacteria bacterium]|nr:hypothetical protein [candidate division Zixibacteria bacterium]